tara:strand:+ start:1816 stop:2319 length:504 start_codon:yes stop_codon:yes gene_type:complete
MINSVLEKEIIIKNIKNIKRIKDDIFIVNTLKITKKIDNSINDNIKSYDNLFGDTNLKSINLIYDYNKNSQTGLICFKFIFLDDTQLIVRDDILDINLDYIYKYFIEIMILQLSKLHKKGRLKIYGYEPDTDIMDKLTLFLMDKHNLYRETNNFIIDCRLYVKNNPI